MQSHQATNSREETLVYSAKGPLVAGVANSVGSFAIRRISQEHFGTGTKILFLCSSKREKADGVSQTDPNKEQRFL